MVIEKYGKIFEATKESPEPAWRPSLPAGASREEAQEVIFQVSVSAGILWGRCGFSGFTSIPCTCLQPAQHPTRDSAELPRT